MTALVIICLFVGFVLLALEVLVIPGFGVAGISGLVLLAVGTFLAWSQYGALWGAASLGATILVGIALLWVVLKTRLGRAAALNERVEEAGVPNGLERYVGAEGVAAGPLRPAGTVLLGEEKVAARTEGFYVPPKTPVVVVRVEGSDLVVEPMEDQDEGPVGPGASGDETKGQDEAPGQTEGGGA